MLLKKNIGRLLDFFYTILKIFFLLSVITVFALKYINPKTTVFILTKEHGGIYKIDLHKTWLPLREISPYLKRAVVVAEDPHFFLHHGFDFNAIKKALHSNQNNSGQIGASTISQQTAKNLFLCKSKSWVRKIAEAYFTVLIETLWSKKRILEVYLNIIETGNGIYGVNLASKYYFDMKAKNLQEYESAAIVAILPNPILYNAKNPTLYIYKKINWIIWHMNMKNQEK